MRKESHWALFGLTKEERDKIDPKCFALPPDAFPCDTQAHLDAAATELGKESETDQATIKRNGARIAKELGLSIPETWQEGAKMTVEFTSTGAEFAGGDRCYIGKVFKAGDYTDKDFSITADELAAKATAFAGVDLDLEHSEFRDVLGHKLGKLVSIQASGKDALGKLSV